MTPDQKQSIEDFRNVLTEFIDGLNEIFSPQELEAILTGNKSNLTSQDLGYKPEAYTEDNLIKPLLAAADIPIASQPYGRAGEHGNWPDGEVKGIGPKVITEHKTLNNISAARVQIKDYLDRKSIGADYGIATDGIEWNIYKIELGGDFTSYPSVREVNLRRVLLTLARERQYIGSTNADPVDVEEELEAFADVFRRTQFSELLTQRAPRELRDARKRDIEEFYELYIELLFGESDDHSYDTSLMDDIVSPRSATQQDERLFAITLMNRLLFIKFLETRGVLQDGFLKERVVDYEADADDFVANLYETQIQPLFYKLLNTPPEQREPKYQDESKWFSSVPYLNGGLFRESIPNERQYTVNDRILPIVVRDLIEGSNLELDGHGFDPAILGSVFEKTINHIEQERNQKDIGAYYTPNDITELIIEQSVDPKLREILIDAIAEETGQTPEQVASIRGNLEGMPLPEMLRNIEDREGWFGNPDAIKRAMEDLRELKIVDPACGSGHFLTSTLDEIHRAQVSLLRCLSKGEEPSAADRYQEKQALALNSVYGVDVDSIAVEIAKLRVWLKIIEGNGWEPEFGDLPNIDVNIQDGNSLIGLPMTGTFDDVDIWSEDIKELEERRREYKTGGQGDPRDLERFMDDEIRPALNDEYLEMYSKPVDSAIHSVDAFNKIIDTIEGPNLYPAIQLVRVKRDDGAAFDVENDAETGPEKARLDDLGFSVYTKTAKLDIQEQESILKRRDDIDNHREHLEDAFRDLLNGPYIFSEVQRQPSKYDLKRILGTPFHWMAEFPEVASEENGRHTLDFDIILGNPPYGDLLGDEEEMFISTYETSGINEISAQFVERQLQLLTERGYFGNITTLGLVYQSGHPEFPDLLRRQLSMVRTACFGLRGRTGIFDNALVRAAVFSGQKNSKIDGTIETSDLILFTDDNRKQRLRDIDYNPTEGLVLRDKIGGNGDDGPVLPKVGPDTKCEVLEHLKAASTDLISEHYERSSAENESHPVWRSGSGGYWINPMLEKLYEGVEPLYFESEFKQRTGFLLLSSSLYYLHWITYGNQRNVSLGTLETFPWPDQDRIEANRDNIMNLSEVLWEQMQGTFQKAHESRGRFVMSPLRPVIDDVDALVGELYGFSDEQVEFIQNYHTDIGEGSGREGDPNASLTYERRFN